MGMQVIEKSLKSLGHLRQWKRCALITDWHVEEKVLPHILHLLQDKEVALFSLPPGEGTKTREWKEKIEDGMLEKGFARDCAILALGGGVILDLAGFVAATFCRGVPLLSIPTTLTAMIDAAIGGKVGVNTPFGKNMIGAFYPAHTIYIETNFLTTLPHNELQNGMAEVIKYGLIASSSLFEKLKREVALEEIVEECIALKQRVVEMDPKELGLRRILNFGHTVGHALESHTHYSVSHGEAVAFGMVVEAFLSYKMGYLTLQEVEEITSLIGRYCTLKLWRGWRVGLDKKSVGGKPRYVLLEKIGQAASFQGEFCAPVEEGWIEEALLWLAKRL